MLKPVNNDYRKLTGFDRNWRPGTPTPPEEYKKRLVRRFWAKVDKTPGLGPWGDCWEWRGARDSTTDNSYGNIGVVPTHGQQLGLNNKYMCVRAHTVAWVVIYGNTIPAGHEMCHKCNNKPCIRESHLFTGTHLENIHHAQETGRMPKVDHELLARLERDRRDAEARVAREFIERHMHLISKPRAKAIMRMRYGYTHAECQTLEEVANCFGVTRERVRQVQFVAEEQIRMYTIEKDIPLPSKDYSGDTKEFRDTLQAMNIGDSFLMPRKKNDHVYKAARSLGYIVTARTVSDTEARVWLVSKTLNAPSAEKAA
jgi:hypothetical protein